MKKPQMTTRNYIKRSAQVLYTDFIVDLLSGASALEEAMNLQQGLSALL
jgi:hypothetical protein